MQAVSLSPTAPAAPTGPAPAEPPRGGAAFDRVLKAIAADPDAAPEDGAEPGAGALAELVGVAVAPEEVDMLEEALETELALPVADGPPSPDVPVALVWPTPFAMAQIAQTAEQLAPPPLAAMPVALPLDVAMVAEGPVMDQDELALPVPPPATSSAPPQPALAAPPALASPPAPPPVQVPPSTPPPAPPVVQALSLPTAAPPGVALSVVVPRAAPAQREAVVPGFWTLRTRDPGAEAQAAVSPPTSTPAPQVAPLPPPAPIGEVAVDLLLPAEPEMALTPHAHLPQGHAPASAQGPQALPPTLAADLSALLARRPDGPVELMLSPEELGRLRISLSQEGDGLVVTVQVERADTLDLLRRNADVLMQEIRAAGFSGGSFSFSGWGGGPGGGATPQPFASFSDTPPPAATPQPTQPATGLDLRL